MEKLTIEDILLDDRNPRILKQYSDFLNDTFHCHEFNTTFKDICILLDENQSAFTNVDDSDISFCEIYLYQNETLLEKGDILDIKKYLRSNFDCIKKTKIMMVSLYIFEEELTEIELVKKELEETKKELEDTKKEFEQIKEYVKMKFENK